MASFEEFIQKFEDCLSSQDVNLIDDCLNFLANVDFSLPEHKENKTQINQKSAMLIYEEFRLRESQEIDEYQYGLYTQLFEVIRQQDQLKKSANFKLVLPGYWVNDVVNSFVKKFHSYKGQKQIWTFQEVVAILQQNLTTSKWLKHKEIDQGLNQLGLVSLSALVCIYLSYNQFNKIQEVLEDTEATLKASESHPICQDLFFNVSLWLFISGRVKESGLCLNYILHQLSRNQFEADLEKLNILLAVVISLIPLRVDEKVHTQMLDGCGELYNKLQKYDLESFSEAFRSLKLCLKEDQSILQMFQAVVKEQLHLSHIRNTLKMFSQIPYKKLQELLGVQDVKRTLEEYITKMNQKITIFQKDQDLQDITLNFETDFVKIQENKQNRRYAEYFQRHISKLKEISENLKGF